MSYFLYDAPLHPGQTVPFQGEEARHLLKSRRMRNGERFALQDPAGSRFSAELVDIRRDTATVTIIAPLPLPAPPRRQVALIQGAVKEKATDWIIQKGTELGLARLAFFTSHHGTVTNKSLGSPKTRIRWERIAWEACKQSDRQFPPEIEVEDALASVLTSLGPGSGGRRWLLDPEASQSIGEALAGLDSQGRAGENSLHLLVGPEGGLSSREKELAREAGFIAVGMGGNILRAETAALAACALSLLG